MVKHTKKNTTTSTALTKSVKNTDFNKFIEKFNNNRCNN